MKVFISQSNYIPWHGFFAMIRHVDLYVILDAVQFTRRDWRTRNKIVLAGKERWLTIPVSGPRSQAINEVLIADQDWPRNHLRLLQSAYGRLYSTETSVFVDELYGQIANLERLTEVNENMIRHLLEGLDIDTPMIRSESLPGDGDASERLARMTEAVGASEYWTGPAARSYLNAQAFTERAIEVRYFDLSALKGVQDDIEAERSGGFSIMHDIAHFGLGGASSRSSFVG